MLKLRSVPAAMALLVQCAAGLTVLIVSGALPVATPLFVLVLMQGLTAALCSACLGMASWWRWIHAFFPLLCGLCSVGSCPVSCTCSGLR